MKTNRGFSLLLVMLVMVVLAIVGVAAATMSQTEAGTASARMMRRQAVSAAEAGLNHFFGAKPAVVQPDTYYVGAIGDEDSSYVYLREGRTPTGQALEARYRVRSTDDASLGSNTVLLISEGQVLVDGSVAATALVSAIVTATPGSSSGVVGTGQKSLGAWGTSSNMPAHSDVSLVDFEGSP